MFSISSVVSVMGKRVVKTGTVDVSSGIALSLGDIVSTSSKSGFIVVVGLEVTK